jgi:hypothetical protein
VTSVTLRATHSIKGAQRRIAVARKPVNIVVPPFPRQSWQPDQAATALAELYDWACTHTTAAIDWYLEKKAVKARGSRWLRLAAILLVTAGGSFPVLVSTFGNDSLLGIGYLFLAGAAGCVAVDRFFGISTAWMRYLTTELTLQRELQRFHVEWSKLSARCGSLLTADEVEAHLTLLGTFVDRVSEEMEAETRAWVEEFRGSLTELTSTATARTTN